MTDRVLLTEPGLYMMADDDYHADPVKGGSLSSHGARELLACPAAFKYRRDHHVKVHKPEYDEGTAAHLAVLGAGSRVVVVEADDWRSKDAQDARKDAYAAGRTPILAHKWEQIRTGQVAKVRAHRLASALLSGGSAEQVLIWRDEATGVQCRSMVDYLTRAWMVDYKTCESAEPAAIQRAIANYGYYNQGAFYVEGGEALGLGTLPFYFVFQEKDPPHEVTVAQLSPEFLTTGRARMRRAREMFRDCTASGIWPSYLPDDQLATIDQPRWLRTDEE